MKQNAVREGFLTSFSWMGASEGALRVIRLLTTVVVARWLTPEDYGVVAMAMTVHELVFVLARNGLSVRLIQCSEKELAETTWVAHRANTVAALGLFLLQVGLAYPLARHFEEPRLAPMLVCLSLVHLIAPLSFLPFSLLQRRHRLKPLALATVATVGVDNLLSMILALIGLGPWALILPKVLVAPIWTAMLRRACPSLPSRVSGPLPWRATLMFGLPLLASEVVKAGRCHLDYLLVAHFLGVEALGIYFFAFNAGLGVSSALVRAFGTALLPHLCGERQHSAVERLGMSYRKILLPTAFLVILQCAAAPFYVPLLFGETWRPAIPVLVLICLSSIPRVFEEGTSQLLRACGLPALDLAWNVMFTGAVLLAVRWGVAGGLLGVAVAVLASYSLILPGVAFWASKTCLRNRRLGSPVIVKDQSGRQEPGLDRGQKPQDGTQKEGWIHGHAVI